MGRPEPLILPLPIRSNTRGSFEMGVVPDLLPGQRPLDDAEAQARLRRLWGGEPCWSRGKSAEEFIGAVAQDRLSPVVQQNVVTYQTLIDVPNMELKLRPGMTANVTVETPRRNNVLRVSNAGLRFKPTTETYALLGQAAPVDAGRSTGTRVPAAGPSVMNARLASAAPFGTASRVARWRCRRRQMRRC